MNDSDSVSGSSPQPGFFSKLLDKLLLRQSNSLKESLAEAIAQDASSGNSTIEREERVMLRNVLSFSEKVVEDIHIPRPDIAAVDDTISMEELRKIASEIGHTRLPVYHETMDDIRGFIHIKDLLALNGHLHDATMEQLMRPVLFVPPSMKINALLVKMQTARTHMAIVVDEYGGTIGLATMEDVVEEIVGDIEDEHDTEEDEADLVQLETDVFEVSARIKLDDLETQIQLHLIAKDDEEAEDVDTLGGLIFLTLGRVPSNGEVIAIPATPMEDIEESGDNAGRTILECEILEADPRRIKRVLLRLRQLLDDEPKDDYIV